MISEFAINHQLVTSGLVRNWSGGKYQMYQSHYPHSPSILFALSKGFRDWIGPPASLSIDRAEAEITWQEVIEFDDNVNRVHQQITEAIVKTSLIKSIFIFSKNILIQLDDIACDGIWITTLVQSKKHVFRLLIKT